jgi:hypothetical protein
MVRFQVVRSVEAGGSKEALDEWLSIRENPYSNGNGNGRKIDL